MRYFLLVGLASIASAVEYRLPRNQTHVREEAFRVRTTAGDVRSATPMTMAAGAPIGRGSVILRYGSHDIWWDDVDPEAQGEKQMLVGTLRSRVWKRVGMEVDVVGLDAEQNDGMTVGDMAIRSVFPLREERYSAVSLTATWLIPIGGDEDLEYAHGGGKIEGSGGALGLRWSESIGLATFHLNVDAQFYPNAKNMLHTDILLKDGHVIPAGEYEHRFYEGRAAVSGSYRWTKWLRTGIDGEAIVQRWDGDEDDQTMEAERYGVIGWIGFNWRPGSQVVLGAGINPQLDGKRDSDEMIYRAGLELDF